MTRSSFQAKTSTKVKPGQVNNRLIIGEEGFSKWIGLSTANGLGYSPGTLGSQMPSPVVTEPKETVPLCVDLDGTLIKTDLLWESLVRLLKNNPFYLLVIPFWWARGRAFLKRQLATRVHLEPSALPYNTPFLAFLRQAKQEGRRLVLVTASD